MCLLIAKGFIINIIYILFFVSFWKVSVQIQDSQFPSLTLQLCFSKNILANFRSSWPSLYTLFLWFEDARDRSLHCSYWIYREDRQKLPFEVELQLSRVLTWHDYHTEASVITRVCKRSAQETEAEAQTVRIIFNRCVWDSAPKPRKKVHFHLLALSRSHLRLSETSVLSILCNFTFTQWLSSVVVIWTTQKSLVWGVLGVEAGLARRRACWRWVAPPAVLEACGSTGSVCAHLPWKQLVLRVLSSVGQAASVN